jgi:hypothetical protein
VFEVAHVELADQIRQRRDRVVALDVNYIKGGVCMPNAGGGVIADIGQLFATTDGWRADRTD